MYGFYSAESDAWFGHAVYLTPNGVEVKVTFATSDPSIDEQFEQYHAWEDKEFVGQLGDFIRSVVNYKNRKTDAVWRMKPYYFTQGAIDIAEFGLFKKSRLRRERL